jgi:hypothetical protein
MVQGVVIGAVDGTSKQGHQAVGLVLVQTRLAEPYKVGGIEVVEVAVWAYVEVHRIVAEATYERIPAIEPMTNVDDASSDLTSEGGKLGGQTVDNDQAQEWFRDRMVEAAQLCGQTTDLGAVLDEGFSGQHAGLEKPSEH